MGQLIPLLAHLTPPIGVTQIRLDRFSPNHVKAEEMGFTNVRPFPSYGYVYPLSDEALNNVAYFFTYQYADRREPCVYAKPMVDAADEWLRVCNESAMFLVDKGSTLIICDLRAIARRPFYVLSGAEAAVYRACDRARSLVQLRDLIGATGSVTMSEDHLHASLQRFKDWGLVIEDDGQWLSLATALRHDLLSEAALRKFHRVVNQFGRKEGDEVVISLSTTELGETSYATVAAAPALGQ
jgi:hypothetical protein